MTQPIAITTARRCRSPGPTARVQIKQSRTWSGHPASRATNSRGAEPATKNLHTQCRQQCQSTLRCDRPARALPKRRGRGRPQRCHGVADTRRQRLAKWRERRPQAHVPRGSCQLGLHEGCLMQPSTRSVEPAYSCEATSSFGRDASLRPARGGSRSRRGGATWCPSARSRRRPASCRSSGVADAAAFRSGSRHPTGEAR